MYDPKRRYMYDPKRRYITWSTDKVDNALTEVDALAEARDLIASGNRDRVFVLEILHTVERSVPPISVSPFRGGKV